MKKTNFKFLKLQIKLLFFVISLSFVSCGPLSSYNLSSNDGIYSSDNKIVNNQTPNNQNGLYYKNYFEYYSLYSWKYYIHRFHFP